jgi:hypothetical protein
MGPSVSKRKESILVQRRWEFGSMIRVCVSARKETVCVLLGTQYGSQCEYKRHQCVLSHLDAKFCCSSQRVLLRSLFTLQNLDDSLSLAERNVTTPVHEHLVLRRATQHLTLNQRQCQRNFQTHNLPSFAHHGIARPYGASDSPVTVTAITYVPSRSSSSKEFHSLDWQPVIDVSVQPIGLIFKGHTILSIPTA